MKTMDGGLYMLVLVIAIVGKTDGRRGDMPDPTPASAQASVDCGSKPADIVFLLDASNSIWPPHFRKQINFVTEFIRSFEIGPNATRVGVLTFGSYARLVFHLYHYTDKNTMATILGRVRQMGSRTTNTGGALRYMRLECFRRPNGDRPGAVNIGIVITDGSSQDWRDTHLQARLARSAGIHLFAIGVGDRQSINVTELMAMASAPKENYVFEVDDYDSLESIRHLLKERTCKVTDRPRPPPPTTPKPTTTQIPSTKRATTQKPTPSTKPTKPTKPGRSNDILQDEDTTVAPPGSLVTGGKPAESDRTAGNASQPRGDSASSTTVSAQDGGEAQSPTENPTGAAGAANGTKANDRANGGEAPTSETQSVTSEEPSAPAQTKKPVISDNKVTSTTQPKVQPKAEANATLSASQQSSITVTQEPEEQIPSANASVITKKPEESTKIPGSDGEIHVHVDKPSGNSTGPPVFNVLPDMQDDQSVPSIGAGSKDACGNNVKVDMMYIMPDNASMNKTKMALRFFSKLTSLLEVEDDKVRIGMVPSHCDELPGLRLDSHYSTKALQRRFEEMEPKSDDLSSKLRYLRTQSYSSCEGHREGVHKVAVVVVDKEADDLCDVVLEANAARRDGTEMFVAAVGDKKVKELADEIASVPVEERVFPVSSHDKLPEIAIKVKVKVNDYCKDC